MEPTRNRELISATLTGPTAISIKGSGRAVVAVVHDLSLAKANGTHAVLMNRGEIVTRGPIHEVFSRENLNSVYQLDVYKWMKEMYSQWDEQ